MGDSVAGVTARARAAGLDFGLDFALIGHQDSWRAAWDVLSFLRGCRARANS